jgi:hypothetical protein
MKDEASYVCESCGEEIVVPIDLSAGAEQEYVEDCPVCCYPNVVHVESIRGSGKPFRPWAVLVTSRSNDLVLIHEMLHWHLPQPRPSRRLAHVRDEFRSHGVCPAHGAGGQDREGLAGEHGRGRYGSKRGGEGPFPWTLP